MVLVRNGAVDQFGLVPFVVAGSGRCRACWWGVRNVVMLLV